MTNTNTTATNLVVSRSLQVTFRLPGETTDRQMNCSITDGYSTEADLPKIIAIALPGYRDASEVTVTAIETISTHLVPPLH